MSPGDEDPYPPSPLEAWLDKWFPRFLWLSIVGILALAFAPAMLTPP